MKAWSEYHPKAKLMARKRAEILDAARQAFLRSGYEGASMEGIAAAAGVSIMTLYRHAESKDDLFAAVILEACDHAPDAHHADTTALMQRPLKEVLVEVGGLFQEKLTRPDTIALFRIVMVETSRFPHLAEAAYRGFVQSWEDGLDAFFSQRVEFNDVEARGRRDLIASFLDDLIGTDMLRMLCGLAGASAGDRERRSDAAAEKLLAALRG